MKGNVTRPLDRPGSGPVAETVRIEAIDVLRGFALLGILVRSLTYGARQPLQRAPVPKP